MEELNLTYKTDIDYERLDKLDLKGVIDYAEENFSLPEETRVSFKSMASIMLYACNTVELTPDNEQFLFILCNMNRVLCESCAGSGKTTMSQMSILKYKLINRIPSEELLCIAYNKNAVEDMSRRHADLVDLLNIGIKATYQKQLEAGKTKKLWKDVMLDPHLRCSTMHALARTWVTTYATTLGINAASFFMDDDQATIYMEKAIAYAIKQNTGAFKDTFQVKARTIDSLMRVYGYCRETLTRKEPTLWGPALGVKPGQAFNATARDGSLTLEQYLEVFDAYDRYKAVSKRMDFNDLLEKFYDILGNPEICARVRQNYKVILVDEYQDITPSMLRIIRRIAEGDAACGIPRYDTLKLICVGDTDQSIYGYRGTDPRNCLRFKQDYCRADISDARILSMSVNRRCTTNILDAACKVILSSAERIDKPIRGLKPGGQVIQLPYMSDPEQAERIIDLLRSMSPDERGETVICYRNNSSANYISTRLFKEEIPFKNLKSSQTLFSDALSQLARKACSLFNFPANKEFIKYVFQRTFPTSRTFTRNDLNAWIDSFPEDTPFFKMAPKPNEFSALISVSNVIGPLTASYNSFKRGGTLQEFMPAVFALFRDKRKYFLRERWRSSESYYAFIEDWFSAPRTLRSLTTSTDNTYSKFADAESRHQSVSMSAFHGLKGLEFDTVIIMDFAHDQIPGGPQKEIDKTNTTAEEQEAIRLFYVALTRARKSCYIFYPGGSGWSTLLHPLNEDLRERARIVFTPDKISNETGLFVTDESDQPNIVPNNEPQLPSLDSIMPGPIDLPWLTGTDAATASLPDNSLQQPTGLAQLSDMETEHTQTSEFQPPSGPPIPADTGSAETEDLLDAYFSKTNASALRSNNTLSRKTAAMVARLNQRAGGTIKPE